LVHRFLDALATAFTLDIGTLRDEQVGDFLLPAG
jgi:hypothetical protein